MDEKDSTSPEDHEEGANLAPRPKSAGRWRSRHGHYEYDEVVLGKDDGAPLVLARRWIGDWEPIQGPVEE